MQNEYIEIAKEVRRISLLMAVNAHSSHSGGALSMADILTVLYSGVINVSPSNVNDSNRDRFLLSKGHCCASLYAILAIKGFLSKEELIEEYGKNGGIYFSHVSHKLNGVEMSSGSLGHGLSVACGIAKAGIANKKDYDTYVLVGDGELDEGSCWEAILFAGHHQLNHLCLIIDYNKIQSLGDVKDVCGLSPLSDKFRAFNWNVVEIDGHNYSQIETAFSTFKAEKNRPTVIIANTIKGKGVSYMENKLKWHYSTPNEEQMIIAMRELA